MEKVIIDKAKELLENKLEELAEIKTTELGSENKINAACTAIHTALEVIKCKNC